MATFSQINEIVQRLRLEMDARSVKSATDIINDNTKASQNNASAIEASARAQTNFEKSGSRAEDVLRRMRMQTEPAFAAFVKLQKVVSAINKLDPQAVTPEHISLAEKLTQKVMLLESAVNDNATAFSSMTARMSEYGQEGVKAIKVMEEFNRAQDKMRDGLRKASEERKRQDSEAAAESARVRKEMSEKISSGMSLHGGYVDKYDVGQKMGAVGKEKADRERAERDAASAARVSGMTALMSSSGARDEVGSKLGVFAVTEAIQRDTAAKEANIAANKRLVDGMGAIGKKSVETAEFIKKMTGATTGNTAGATQASGGLTKLQKLTVQQTLGDVVSSLSTGQSPQTILLQQGEQFLQPFGTGMEGIKNAARTLGPILLRLVLNPITAIAAATATAAYAMYRWKGQTDELQYSLNGLGRQTGLTVSQLNRIAESAGNRAGISNASARGLAGGFASAGVSSGSIGGAVDLTRSLSKTLGVDLADMGKELASALADPARGADELAKKYGVVTFAQREQIKLIAAVGDKSGATAKLLDALTKSLDGMQAPTTAWGRMVDALSKRVSDKADQLGKELEVSLSGQKSFKSVFDPLRQASAKANEAEQSRAQERTKELNQLRENNALAVAELSARTFAEREAVAAERARVETMRSTYDAVKANIAAEGERAKLLAESTRKVQDLTRASSDTLSMSRMSPYDRRMAEISNSERDFRRENIPDLAKPVVTSFDFAARAAKTLGDALAGAAGKLGRMIPLDEWKKESSDVLGRAREAIAAIESKGSGDYGAIGPRTKSGDRAYGRYQVMGDNIGPWTKDALGRSLTPKEFLADQGAQDAVFNRQFGKAMIKYGNASDAASVWFTGRPLAQGASARDVTGTTGASYASKFDALMSGSQAKGASGASLSAQTGAAFDAQREAANFEFYDKAIQQVNQDINAQRDLLDKQAASLGLNTEQVAYATKQQELLNQFQSQGIPITDSLRAMIDSTATNYADLARRTEEAADRQRNLADALDIVRSTTQDIGTSLADAFRRGENAGKAMLNVLDRLASKMLDKSLSLAIDGLFGKMGGTSAGAFGSIVGGIGKMFGFADGGVMSSGGPVPLMAYANGGVANRPQMALFGEGRRPEAFVPLPDGRAIPVKMNGQQQQRTQVVINNNASGLVDLQAREDQLTGRILVTVNSMIGSSMKKVPGIVADAQRRSL